MKNILVSPNLKIIKAMKKLAQTGERCLIVVDSQKKLLGTMTDGDIRRGILGGLSIDQSIKSIYSRKPSTVGALALVAFDGSHNYDTPFQNSKSNRFVAMLERAFRNLMTAISIY